MERAVIVVENEIAWCEKETPLVRGLVNHAREALIRAIEGLHLIKRQREGGEGEVAVPHTLKRAGCIDGEER